MALITTPRAHAYCPTLLAYGAATWGATREEVLGPPPEEWRVR